MHVLTKIFVVLVSLLAVLLVPLVVVYAHNEDSFKARYEAADAEATAANTRLRSDQVAHVAGVAQLQSKLQELQSANEALMRERDRAEADIRGLETDLAMAQAQQDKVRADLAQLSEAVSAGQQLMDQLLSELASTRSQAMDSERRTVQLDEALREKSAQLDVAVAARKAVQEQLQQLKEEMAGAMQSLAMYKEKFGDLDQEVLATGPLPTTVDLDGTILNVRRGLDQTLAEINVGSRDGVQEGWKMFIGRGGNFLANLRIIEVDLNRSTGIVELEDPDGRGRVEAGDRVYARAGHS